MSKKNKNFSGLKQHALKGKTLTPPFASIPNMSLTSWRDERLPDMIWAVLLTGALERNNYLSKFRMVVSAATRIKEKASIVHSENSKLSEQDFDTIFSELFESREARKALCVLLLLPSLPDKAHWERHLSAPEEPQEAIDILARSVARTIDHQSEASTDCRWLKVIFKFATGKVHMPAELAETIINFPNIGDMRNVRPSIRATEQTFSAVPKKSNNLWPEEFWRDCWETTHCIPAPLRNAESVNTETALSQLAEIYTKVVDHFSYSRCNTSIDPRFDSVFDKDAY
jgi:hypothetical protein